MPDRDPVQRILAEFKKREDFIALIGYGSTYEERRTAGAGSDLDLIALVTSRTWELHVLSVDGVKAEIFVRSCYDVLNNILERDDNFEIRNIGPGRLLYSADPISELIKDLATEKYLRLGSSPYTPASAFLRRVAYGDLLATLGSDPLGEAEQRLLMDWIFAQLLEDWFRFRHLYVEKFSYHLQDMREHDPRMVDLARAYLAGRGLRAEAQLLEEMASHCLATVGGLPPVEWEIQWSGGEVRPLGEDRGGNDGHRRRR